MSARDQPLLCRALGAMSMFSNHIRHRIAPVFGTEFDLIDWLVAAALPLLVHASGAVDVAVWRAVELDRVGVEGMGAELLDIDGDRRGQALGAQYIEPRRRASRVCQQGQVVLHPRLVRGDQRWGVLNGSVGAGEMGDPGFAIHGVRPPKLLVLWSGLLVQWAQHLWIVRYY